MSENQLPTPADNGRASSVQVREAGAGGMLLPQTLTDVITFAQVMSKADVALPKFLRGNEGACLAVAMQAFRWEMDPFAVANKSYYVNDRVAYEAQLVAAVVHTRAPIKRRPDYQYIGEGLDRQCRVTCEMSDGSVKEYVSPKVRDILVKNSPLWKADTDQQLGYYSIRSFARRHCPEVILGVYTPDEVSVMRDVTPVREPSGLSDRLKTNAIGGEGGFGTVSIDEAIEGEFEERSAEEAAQEGQEPADADTEAQAPEEPQNSLQDDPGAFAGDPPPEEAPSGVRDMSADQRMAWVESLRASLIRERTVAAAMRVWRATFDEIEVLKMVDEPLFLRLSDWFERRIKSMREREAAQ